MIKIIKNLLIVVHLIQLSQVFASPANEPSSFPSHSKSPKPTAKKPGQGKVSPFPNESRNSTWPYISQNLEIRSSIEAKIQQGFKKDAYIEWDGRLIDYVEHNNIWKKDDKYVLMNMDKKLSENVKIIFCFWCDHFYRKMATKDIPNQEKAAYEAACKITKDLLLWVSKTCSELRLTTERFTVDKYITESNIFTPVVAILDTEDQFFVTDKKPHTPANDWEAIVKGIHALYAN